jgi:uracil-DNA glycosylase
MKPMMPGCADCRDVPDLATPARNIVPWSPPGPKRVVVVSMEMDRRESPAAIFLEREILGPLGMDRGAAHVADLVRCFFSAPPAQIARERRCALADVLRPAARRCVPHLEYEVEMLGAGAIVTIGEVVYDLLREFWNLEAGPIRGVFGTPIEIARGSRVLPLIPCVTPQHIVAEPEPYAGQAARLARIRLAGGVPGPVAGAGPRGTSGWQPS